MSRDTANDFVARIRTALRHQGNARRNWQTIFGRDQAEDRHRVLERIKSRSHQERKGLLERVVAEAGPLNLNVIPLEDASAVTAAVAELVRRKEPEWGDKKTVVAWRHPLIESLGLPEALVEQQVQVFYADPGAEAERELCRKRAADAFIGVTSADYCVAESATLVLKTRPGQGRSVSLLPSIHVAVIDLGQIIANLKELFVILRWDPDEQREGLTNCLSLISGPSKTADIEATMVHGAHGPRELYLFVITGE